MVVGRIFLLAGVIGDFDRDGGPFVECALQVDGTVEEVYVSLDDMKAEAGSLDVLGVGAAEEAAEQVLLVFVGNADAFIPDRQAELAVFCQGGVEVDGGSFGRKFYGIAQEIDQDILQEAFVADECHTIGREAASDLLSVFCQGAHFFDDFVEELSYGKFGGFCFYLSFFELAEGQEVVEQGVEVFDGVFYPADVFVPFVLVLCFGVSSEEGGGAEDGA